MSSDQKPDDDFLLTFSDLIRVFKRNRNKIAFFAVVFALLGAWYTLTKPVSYLAEATFREKGKSQSGVKSIGEYLFGGSSGGYQSEATSVMQSAKLQTRLAEKLGLQASLGKKEDYKIILPLQPTISQILTNLKIQYAHLRDRKVPIHLPGKPTLFCEGVKYTGETPLGLTLLFHPDESFEVRNQNDEVLGIGKIGTSFEGKDYAFTIVCENPSLIGTEEYALNLEPIRNLLANFKSNLKITEDKDDKFLLTLNFTHPDRYYATRFLDELMASYQDYLQKEHEFNSETQLAYLKKRQKESADTQKKVMEDYAAERERDLTHSGTIDSEKEMEFLMENQKRDHQKLIGIELTSKRLQNVLNGGPICFDQALIENNSGTINTLFDSLDSLKQHSITISLALRENKKEQTDKEGQLLETQITDLNEIRYTIHEVKTLTEALKQDVPLEADLEILHNSKFLVNTWLNRLQEAAETNQLADFEQQKTSYLSYLNNLLRLLEVQEKTIQDRIAHQYTPQMEFQGITLETANQLYREYTAEYQKMEAEIVQNQFITEQLKEPNFEIFSLGSVLTDPVSQGIINRSSGLALQLRDQNNRSIKEQERTKNELDLQKHFLISHLEQTQKLQEIRIKLLQDKIQSLQEITLELLHQKISVIEQHIKDLVSSRLYSLGQERLLVESQLANLNKQMAQLPKKWVSEQLIKSNLLFNKATVEELARMVEGKNITSNLELIQSAPLDAAFAPILPKSPRLLFFIILGACFGAFLSMGYFVVKSAFAGVGASVDNLNAAGQNVSGTLSKHIDGFSAEPLADADLETLRRIIAFSDAASQTKPEKRPHGQTLLLLEGHGPDYSSLLAQLMARKGLKVLILPLTFDQSGSSEHLPGLYQVLEGQASEPKILSTGSYDRIAPGGVCRYSSELVCSDAFKKLLTLLQHTYDIILGVSNSLPLSAEAQMLFEVFDHMAVTLQDEKLLDLTVYTKFALEAQSKKKVTFVLVQND